MTGQAANVSAINGGKSPLLRLVRLRSRPASAAILIFGSTVAGCASAQTDSQRAAESVTTTNAPLADGYTPICGQVEIAPKLWWHDPARFAPEVVAQDQYFGSSILVGEIVKQMRKSGKDTHLSGGGTRVTSLIGNYGITSRCLATNAITIKMHYDSLPNGAPFQMTYQVSQFGSLLGNGSANVDISAVPDSNKFPRNPRMIGKDIIVRAEEIYKIIKSHI